MKQWTDFILEKTCQLLAIPGPSGYAQESIRWLKNEFEVLGYSAAVTHKGGLVVDLGGPASDNALLLEAHADRLGAMVAEIKGNGRLRLTNIGGMNANNAEAENAIVRTRSGKTYEGTLQLINASVHVNGDYSSTSRNWNAMEFVLDEEVYTAEDVRKLGIRTGDVVCFDSRTRVTESGYIKRRFLMTSFPSEYFWVQCH